MALLTTDGTIRGLWPFLTKNGSKVGRVTVQAAPYAIALLHLFAEILFLIGWLIWQSGSNVPAHFSR
jgi:hypothetical protein